MASQNVEIPHLCSIEGGKQLIVNGRPFLILGAELQNSSLTSAEHMDTVWPNLVASHVNTVLGCVTWEMIEPVEGQFDFEELDKIILGARKHGFHLVLLWFGSYKNGSLPPVDRYALQFDEKANNCQQESQRTLPRGSRRTPNASPG